MTDKWNKLNKELDDSLDSMTDKDWEKYSPYCPICSGCGEDGCCRATICQQHPDGHYCESYLKELKFGYKMYHHLLKLVDGDEKYKEQVDKIWDETWDEIFDKKDE